MGVFVRRKRKMRGEGLPSWGSGLVILGLGLLMIGCASGRVTQQVPEWVLSTPQGGDGQEIFVVSGNNPQGNLTEAEEAASAALLSEINQYLGVDITQVATSEGRGSIDAYETEIKNTITLHATGLVTGLRIEDRYVLENANGITVFILAAYDRLELEKERQKRQALLEEKEDAVSVPEEKGDDALAQGRYYQAAVSFAEAAAAALGSDIRNADIKFERIITKLTQVIQELELRVLEVPEQLVVNQQNQAQFGFGAYVGEQPVSGVDLRVSFREARNSGRARIQSIQVKTNQDGRVGVQLPPPTLVGRQELSVQLDIAPLLRPLESVPREKQGMVDALLDAAAGKIIQVPYEVISLAREIPLGVYVIDTDVAGNAIEDQRATAQGIIQELSGAGFSVRLLGLDPREVSPEFQVVNATVESQGSAAVQRLVIGTASLVSVEQRDGFLVQVSGTVEVYDRRSGELLYSRSGIKNSQGASSARAISSAFTALGRDFGALMVSQLP